MLKLTLQASTTLSAVVGLYLAPWLLNLGQQPMAPTSAPMEQASREAVVWIPPPAAAPEPAADSPAVAFEEVEEPTEVGGPADPPTPPADVDPDETDALVDLEEEADAATPPPDAAPSATKRGVRRDDRRGRPRPTRAASGVEEAPKPPPTRKQQRRRLRWDRKQERLAKQPQCRDHMDEMVRIDQRGRHARWMVSEALVGCYRDHPGQFVNIGGMDWAHDERGRKQGLEIYVSRRERGDVARAIGLRRGDVLTRLNGVSLRKPATATFALTQLTRGQAKLEFERAGERHVLEVTVVDGGAIAALQRARQTFGQQDRRIARARAADDR